MAPDRHVANRVIILVSASYRSTDVQVVKEIVSNEGIGLISVGLDGSVGAMKPLSGYDVTQIRELNGIREKVQLAGQLMSMAIYIEPRITTYTTRKLDGLVRSRTKNLVDFSISLVFENLCVLR